MPRNYALKHNRAISYYDHHEARRDLLYEQSRPTAKQKSYFLYLVRKCAEHGIEVNLGQRVKTRVEYADAIDMLRKSLSERGVEPGGNGLDMGRVVTVREDGRGRLEVRENLVQS